MAIGEPPPNFTHYEWAAIGVLRAIRRDLVLPRIEDWKRRVTWDVRLRQNIQSAFANLECLSDRQGSHAREGLIGQRSREDLNGLLEERGHELFNAFFYCAILAFGERWLIPVTLGAQSPAREDLGKQFNRRMRYLASLRVPYRLHWDDLPAYGSQILPCTGGTAPSFYGFVREAWDLYRERCREQKVPEVPADHAGYWLGRLGLLHKEVDFGAGHQSAVMATLEPHADDSREYPTVVLTSILPEAFEKKDRQVLYEILREEYSGGSLADSPKYEGLYAVPYVRIAHNPRIPNLAIEIPSIDARLKSVFPFPDEDGLVAYRALFDTTAPTGPVPLLESTAINTSALYRLIPRMFPDGPWLDRRLVCAEGGPVDFGRLHALATFWDNLFEPTVKALHTAVPPLIMELWNVLFPDESGTSFGDLKRNVYSLAVDENRLLVCLASADWDAAPLAQLARELNDALGDTDASRAELFKLNRDWREHDLGLAASSLAPTQPEVALKNFLERGAPNARAVIVVDKASLAIPEGDPSATSFYAATYPIYWLFESAVREMSERGPATRGLRAVRQRMPHPYFCSNDDGYPSVSLNLPSGEAYKDYRRTVLSGVNYFGMPLKTDGLVEAGEKAEAMIWRDGALVGTAELDSHDPIDAIYALRKEWLRVALGEPGRLPCVIRARAKERDLHVPETIEIEQDGLVHKLSDKQSSNAAQANWRLVVNYKLSLLALSTDSILKGLATATQSPFLHVSSETERAGASHPTIGVLQWPRGNPARIDSVAATELGERVRASYRELMEKRIFDAYSVGHPLKNRLAPVYAQLQELLEDRVGVSREHREQLSRLASLIKRAVGFSDLVTILYRIQERGASAVLDEASRFSEEKPLVDVLGRMEKNAQTILARSASIKRRLAVTRADNEQWFVRASVNERRRRPADLLYDVVFDELLHNAIEHGESETDEIVSVTLCVEKLDDGCALIVLKNKARSEFQGPSTWTLWNSRNAPAGGGVGLQFCNMMLTSGGFGRLYYRREDPGGPSLAAFGLQLIGLEREEGV
jgi:signal transduction histidine kinase